MWSVVLRSVVLRGVVSRGYVENMRIDVLGVGFDDITLEQAVSSACGMISNGERAYAVTPNPEIVWIARHDEGLRKAVNDAALVLPDGVGIILGAKILGDPLRGGRVPGIEFADAMLRKLSESGKSVFLLGAKPGVAEEAGQKLAEKYAGLEIAGVSDGYFADDEPVIGRINAARPDLLLVCLGAPKQELWMSKNIGRLDAGLCVGLGGALDVFAGRIKRAPVFFLKFGLEWLYRIIREPRRIRRSLKLPLFVIAVVWKRIFGHGNAYSF